MHARSRNVTVPAVGPTVLMVHSCMHRVKQTSFHRIASVFREFSRCTAGAPARLLTPGSSSSNTYFALPHRSPHRTVRVMASMTAVLDEEPVKKRARTLDKELVENSMAVQVSSAVQQEIPSDDDKPTASGGRRRRRPLTPPRSKAPDTEQADTTAKAEAEAPAGAEAAANGATGQPVQQRSRSPSPEKLQPACPQVEPPSAQTPSPTAAPAAAATAAPVAPQAAPAAIEDLQQQQQQHQQQSPVQPTAQQTQQRQQQQQQQAGQTRAGKKAGKKQAGGRFPHLAAFHQCVKRELPYEALHLYEKIKEQKQGAPLDPALCSSLLNVSVGNWIWEMHQRHQHLVRTYTAEGQDTAPLQQAFDAYLTAERERQRHQQEQQQQEKQEKQAEDWSPEQEEEEQQQQQGEDAVPLPDLPPGMLCHITRQATDRSCTPELLKSREGLSGELFEGMPAEQLPLPEFLSKVSALVMADLKAANRQPDEQILMQLARIAGILGKPDEAFEYARRVVAAKEPSSSNTARLIPRLRDFQPALVGYALTGQADKAEEVVQLMRSNCEPADLTESEYALWLEAIAAGGSYEQMRAALLQLSGDLNELRKSTLSLVQQFFGSDRATAALPSGNSESSPPSGSNWQQQWVTPDETGRVAEAGVVLQLKDLSPADWEAFDAQVFKRGVEGEKHQGQFQAFKSWLNHNGPFDVMVDGANVAFWGENYAGGHFRGDKIRLAYETMQEHHPEAKILLVLHQGREREILDTDSDTGSWLQGLRSKKRFYCTPYGMNDDLFWMYAAINAREQGKLVSNDQLRDHVFSMLRPKHMLKWTQRHIVRYHFNFHKTEFYPHEPKPYTPCVQELGEHVWLLPQAGSEEWLCCQPQSSRPTSA